MCISDFERHDKAICKMEIESEDKKKWRFEREKFAATVYFTSDNEPGGSENATHNTFPKLT
jgi:hypothetical protein